MIQLISSSTRAWLHGLFAAAISAFATSASGLIALPTVFNFTRNGLINMLKMAAVPAGIAVFTYLKQSPLPPDTVLQSGDTATVKDPIITSGSISGTSATIQKAASNDTEVKP